MILVDTSVWIDHLRSADAKLQSLLQNDQVMTHPYIRLELALGSMASREKVLADLALLPQTPVVATEELFGLIDHKSTKEWRIDEPVTWKKDSTRYSMLVGLLPVQRKRCSQPFLILS